MNKTSVLPREGACLGTNLDFAAFGKLGAESSKISSSKLVFIKKMTTLFSRSFCVCPLQC